jgi:hypothetical protein
MFAIVPAFHSPPHTLDIAFLSRVAPATAWTNRAYNGPWLPISLAQEATQLHLSAFPSTRYYNT